MRWLPKDDSKHGWTMYVWLIYLSFFLEGHIGRLFIGPFAQAHPTPVPEQIPDVTFTAI